MEMLRTAAAARRLGIHPATLRHWADTGRIPVAWVGRERRFSTADVQALMRIPDRATDPGPSAGPGAERREALYTRVSGSTGQESSLAAQEAELRATTGPVIAIYKDRASGLREDRRGLTRLLADAERGRFTVVMVTHEDRLARFGTGWLERLLATCG
jgi:putative resolvase